MNNLVKAMSRPQNLRKPTMSFFKPASTAAFATQAHFYDILQLDEMRSALREEFERFADAEVKPLRESMDKENVFPA